MNRQYTAYYVALLTAIGVAGVLWWWIIEELVAH